MANTYTLIASNTLSSAAANITFSSIPSTYTDLLIKFSGRSANASVNPGLLIKLNTSSANFSGRVLYGDGSSASSYTDTSGEIGILAGNAATANIFGNCEIYLPNYAGSTYKSISVDSVNENNATSASQYLYASLWSNTAAINSVTLYSGGGANLMTYSTAYLYGIKNS